MIKSMKLFLKNSKMSLDCRYINIYGSLRLNSVRIGTLKTELNKTDIFNYYAHII